MTFDFFQRPFFNDPYFNDSRCPALFFISYCSLVFWGIGYHFRGLFEQSYLLVMRRRSIHVWTRFALCYLQALSHDLSFGQSFHVSRYVVLTCSVSKYTSPFLMTGQNLFKLSFLTVKSPLFKQTIATLDRSWLASAFLIMYPMDAVFDLLDQRSFKIAGDC